MQDAVRAKRTATVKKICMVAIGFFSDRIIHSNCIVIDLREKKSRNPNAAVILTVAVLSLIFWRLTATGALGSSPWRSADTRCTHWSSVCVFVSWPTYRSVSKIEDNGPACGGRKIRVLVRAA